MQTPKKLKYSIFFLNIFSYTKCAIIYLLSRFFSDLLMAMSKKDFVKLKLEKISVMREENLLKALSSKSINFFTCSQNAAKALVVLYIVLLTGFTLLYSFVRHVNH